MEEEESTQVWIPERSHKEAELSTLFLMRLIFHGGITG